ncbi:MAG: hypothetical protein D6757_01670 [Alphaproteobacteria bacterium]|nr:MAG: hypothetical protein D6757_01670 [Alphaproteobacteria bacterium]
MMSWRQISHLPIGAALRRGLDWWLGALASLLPERWRRLPLGWRRELRLIEQDDRLELVLVTGRERVALGSLTLADGKATSTSSSSQVLAAELKAILDQHSDPIDRTVLVIDPAKVLVRDFNLPGAALADPDAAAELEIDRLTPFRAEDVLFAVRPALLASHEPGAAPSGKGAGGELPFRLVLTPKARLAPLFSAFEQAGLRLDLVDLAGLRAPSSRLCPSLAPNNGRWRVAAALAGLALLALSVWLPLHQRAGLAAAKEDEAQRLAPQAAKVAALVRAASAIAERDQWLIAEKRDRLTVLGLLDEVSRAMPDDAFVLQFTQTGERLDLTGYAEKAARLVALLGKAPHLGEPRFTAPVTPDQRLGRERYSLELRVRTRDGEGEAADSRAVGAGSPQGEDRAGPKEGGGA